MLKMERSYLNVFMIMAWSGIGLMTISYLMKGQIFTVLGEYAIVQLCLTPIVSSFISKSPTDLNNQRELKT